MAPAIVGFFLDQSSVDGALARLEAAGYAADTADGGEFDSKFQQGRIALVVTAPGQAAPDPVQAAEIHALLLRAGALDVQEGSGKGAPESNIARQGMPLAAQE